MPAQDARIEGNVIVQIEGDRNVNLKDLAHLTLTRYLTLRRIDTDVDLLSPWQPAVEVATSFTV